MGLDMTLYKKTWVKTSSYSTPEKQHSVTVNLGGVAHPTIQPDRISHIQEEVMYWRKANQIHGWFCKHTNKIEDNIRYDVEREHLENLLLDCKKVLQLLESSPKKTTQVLGGWRNGEEFYEDVEVYDNPEVLEILPPMQGFFFGSYEIDDDYKQDIVNTIEVLEQELSLPEFGYVFYEYHASW